MLRKQVVEFSRVSFGLLLKYSIWIGKLASQVCILDHYNIGTHTFSLLLLKTAKLALHPFEYNTKICIKEFRIFYLIRSYFRPTSSKYNYGKRFKTLGAAIEEVFPQLLKNSYY